MHAGGAAMEWVVSLFGPFQEMEELLAAEKARVEAEQARLAEEARKAEEERIRLEEELAAQKRKEEKEKRRLAKQLAAKASSTCIRNHLAAAVASPHVLHPSVNCTDYIFIDSDTCVDVAVWCAPTGVLQALAEEQAAAEALRKKEEEEVSKTRAVRLAKRRGFAVDAPTHNSRGVELFCMCHQPDLSGGYVECLGTAVRDRV